MPKKYHRPPAAKRRKQRKTGIPYVAEPPPGGDNGPGVMTAEEIAPAPAAPEVPAVPAREEASPSSPRTAPVRHITRDHSYVRAEVIRILLIAGFIIASLLITAALRG